MRRFLYMGLGVAVALIVGKTVPAAFGLLQFLGAPALVLMLWLVIDSAAVPTRKGARH